MAKVNTSGSGEAIYGNVPDLGGQASNALNKALGNADDFYSNTVNGSIKSKDVEYDPENGK